MKALGIQFSRLLKLLRRRGHTREDAEDLIQDAFLSLHTYCRKVEIRSNEAWLVRAVINRSISLYRRRHLDLRAAESVEELALVDQEPAAEDLLVLDQRLERIIRALDAIGPRTRDVFLMHRLWGFTYPEIAARLGVTVSAVERRIARALNAVAVELNGD